MEQKGSEMSEESEYTIAVNPGAEKFVLWHHWMPELHHPVPDVREPILLHQTVDKAILRTLNTL